MPAPSVEPGDAPKALRVPAWPHLVRREVLAAQAVVLGVLLLAVAFDAPLGTRATPAAAPPELKAPWYFVGLQELLVYLDTWVVGGLLPVATIAVLVALPFLDRRRDGSPALSQLGRRVLLAGMLLAWSLPSITGAFLRGPSWTFLWPWQTWNAQLATNAPRCNLAEALGFGGHEHVVGATALATWVGVSFAALRWWRGRSGLPGLGGLRGASVALLAAFFGGIVLKILLQLLFGITSVFRVAGDGL